MNKDIRNEEHEEERVMRDLVRRPRYRKYREILLVSGERVKRTDIGWPEAGNSEN